MRARKSAPHGTRRLHRTRVAAGFLLSWGLVGLLVGTFLLTTGGEHGRVKVLTVLTGSMRPTLGVGDLVIEEVVPARELRAGDITTFREPTGEKTITHRVQSIVWTGQLGDVITRGDANGAGEEWVVPADGALGRVVLHIPKVGYVVGALTTASGRLVITGAALLLGVYALLLIWRPRREDITARLVERLVLLDLAGADVGGTSDDRGPDGPPGPAGEPDVEPAGGRTDDLAAVA